MPAERQGKGPLGLKNYTIVWQYSLSQFGRYVVNGVFVTSYCLLFFIRHLLFVFSSK